MKLSNREITAIADEIKARDEKETDAKRKEFKKKFITESKKWLAHYNKLPECLQYNTSYSNPCTGLDSIVQKLAEEHKDWPKAKFEYPYSNRIERVIVLSMIDAKDVEDLMKKVSEYKF